MSRGDAMQALNRLAKWRTVMAGWQLGTRAKGDPECDAVRDHREATLLMRAEVNALASLLVEKGVFTHDEWSAQLVIEANACSTQLEERFPGFSATDIGLAMDARAADTTKGWRA